MYSSCTTSSAFTLIVNGQSPDEDHRLHLLYVAGSIPLLLVDLHAIKTLCLAENKLCGESGRRGSRWHTPTLPLDGGDTVKLTGWSVCLSSRNHADLYCVTSSSRVEHFVVIERLDCSLHYPSFYVRFGQACGEGQSIRLMFSYFRRYRFRPPVCI